MATSMASPLSDEEQAKIRRVLEAAGFPERELEWMVASCPDLETAERLYGNGASPYVLKEPG
jgi:isopropylmalate/homocitrate/citramalate synthase